MTTNTTAIKGRIDIHRGELVCFIPGVDWIGLEDPPPADMWTDRDNRIWVGIAADNLIEARFLVDVPLRDLKFIETHGVGNGWLQNLIPMVFEEGVHKTQVLQANKAIEPDHEEDEMNQTPHPKIM